MAAMSKSHEHSVTNDIIRRVHLTLADLKSGEEMLGFLKQTEPVFMEEVNRFIQTEIARMRYQLTESQSLYVGSVIGASYIAGFLIARETAHQMFNGLMDFKSDIKRVLSAKDIDKIIDSNREAGKSYKEISKIIRETMLSDKNKITKKKVIKPKKEDRGKRLDIGDLG